MYATTKPSCTNVLLYLNPAFNNAVNSISAGDCFDL